MENIAVLKDPYLSLVTLNCLGVPFVQNTRARLKTMARTLDRAAVDVVCLQEVQLSTYVPLLDQHFSQYPYLAYEPFLYAPKGGLLTFSRRPIADTRFTLYPQRGWWHTPSLADRLLHKGILMTQLVYADQPIMVLNTHLTANYDGDWSPSNRYARLEQIQLRELATVVNAIDEKTLVIIAGDFNIPRHSWLYDEFVAATGVVDPLNGNTRPTYQPVIALPHRYHQPIDHVFVRPPRDVAVTARAEWVFEDRMPLVTGRIGRISDHVGIRVHLAWRPKSETTLAPSWVPAVAARV